ncbi:MAG TPA: DUF2157 domain-containing protein [Blastocatellia bacterium]|nr:DUF2157 domain-containing protein [Blastocatellia bacterium]
MSSQRNIIILEELDRWRQENVIDDELYQQLRQRYTTPGIDFATIIKWILVFGAIVLGGGIALLFFDVFKNIPDVLIVVMLTAVTAAFYYGGHRLAARHRRSLVYSGKALVFVGTITTVVDLIWAGRVFGLAGNHWSLMVAVAAATYFVVGYLLQDLLVLVFGVIATLIWLGTETGYLSGWGTYWLGMNYPLRFVFFGLLFLPIGWFHNQRANRTGAEIERYYSRIYVSIGLLCTLVSLWLTSIVGDSPDPDQFHASDPLTRFFFIFFFTAVAAIIIYYGIKLHDRMLLGYGVVFLCIDVYTRFFEHFWNTLSKSLFFIALGALSLGIGIFLEFSRRNKLATRLIEQHEQP